MSLALFFFILNKSFFFLVCLNFISHDAVIKAEYLGTQRSRDKLKASSKIRNVISSFEGVIFLLRYVKI